MEAQSPGTPARARCDDDSDDEVDHPPETPQQLVDALCANIDFGETFRSSHDHGILALCLQPPLAALPRTPLDETVMGLRVEVERLVEELDLMRSNQLIS